MMGFLPLAPLAIGTCVFLYLKYKKDKKLFQSKLIFCESFLSELATWDNFYIPGSAAQKLCSLWIDAKHLFEGLFISPNFSGIEVYHKFCSCERMIKDKFIARNKLFVAEELVRFQGFFDAVESKKLTEEQRRAAIVNEDHNLIIASAGSGKTLTVIGKVAYLLQKGVPSGEMLVLAFNKKITREIEERFEKMGSPVDVYTMHKLALDICKKSDSSVHVVNDNFESSVQKKFFREVIWGKPTANEVLKYFSYYLYPLPQVDQLENLGDLLRQTQYIKMETLKSLWENHKKEKRGSLETYQGETVKSMGELVIANFLFLNKIEYKYEKRYPVDDFSYHPDFYLPEYDIWIEHFGVTM